MMMRQQIAQIDGRDSGSVGNYEGLRVGRYYGIARRAGGSTRHGIFVVRNRHSAGNMALETRPEQTGLAISADGDFIDPLTLQP
jgi:hypothetical protein